MTHALFEGGQRRANARLREVSVIRPPGVHGSPDSGAIECGWRGSVQALERALVSARIGGACDGSRQDHSAAFEVGATTNLEVIDAQRSARDAGRAARWPKTRAARKAQLLVALGRFPK